MAGAGWNLAAAAAVAGAVQSVSTSYWTHIPGNVALVHFSHHDNPIRGIERASESQREMLIREPGKNKSGLEKYCTIMMAIDVYWILSAPPPAPAVGSSWSPSVAAGGGGGGGHWLPGWAK